MTFFGLSKFQLPVVQLCFKLNLGREPTLFIFSGIILNSDFIPFFCLNDVAIENQLSVSNNFFNSVRS